MSCFSRLLARCLGHDTKQDSTTSSHPQQQQGPGNRKYDGALGFKRNARPEPQGPPPPVPPHERCCLDGPGIAEVAGFAGKRTYFAIACMKEDGGLDSFVKDNLIVEISGPATLVPTITRSQLGAKVSYTARKAGSYTVSIQYFAGEVPGSPYKIEILPGKIDASHSTIEHASGLVQGVLVVPLFMECRIRVVSRDSCDNERRSGGMIEGFNVKTQLLAEDVESESYATRMENEDKAWRVACARPDMVGPLRKKRFGGFTGWEALHCCLAGDAFFYSLSPSDVQPRGVLYLEGSQVRDLGRACFEVFVPLAYSRANVVKERQVNRVFTFKAESQSSATRWMEAIRSAKPLEEEELLEARDGHVEGRGFDAEDIAKLREAIQQSELTAVKQLEFEKQVMREREERGWKRRMEVEGEDDSIDADYVHVEMPSAAKAGKPEQALRDEEEAEDRPAASEKLTSKQARVQAAMRNTALTPQERQRKIQEIMREPAPEAVGEEKKEGEEGASKQERVRRLMQDTSLTPQERQKRIQQVMSEKAKGRPEEADEESKQKLREAQKRVKALLAAGKAELGAITTVSAEETKLADDRPVEVRIVLGDDMTGDVGEEDVIDLGVLPCSSTLREVKAACSYYLDENRMQRLTPERTSLVSTSSGRLLQNEDAILATIDHQDPTISLILVPRGLEGTVQGSIHAQHEIAKAQERERELEDELEQDEPSDVEEYIPEEADAACRMLVEDNSDGSYWLTFSFVARGVFKAQVTYRGSPLKQASFQVIVLKPNVFTRLRATLNPNTSKKSSTATSATSGLIDFPATWLSETEEWVDVELRFAHRQLVVYKGGGLVQALTGLKLFHSRLFSFPIKRNVRFDPLPGGPRVAISDGSGHQLVFSTPDRMIVQASFYLLLQSRIAGMGESFSERKRKFDRSLKAQRPATRGAQVLRVRRNRLVEDAFNSMGSKESSAWTQEWQIRFEGEAGVDWGGLQREFFTVLGRELFDCKREVEGKKLFVRMGSDSGVLVHLNEEARAERQLMYFNFAGKVMGKCLYDAAVLGSHHLLSVHMARSLIKAILGLPVSFQDFETDDPQLFKSKVQFMIDNSIDEAGLDLHFVEETYSKTGSLLRSVELLPGGSKVPVNDANKRRYLRLLALHRLALLPQPWKTQEAAPQIRALVEGFYSIIPEELLEPFDENELELMLCGTPEVSVEDLKRNTQYPRMTNPLGVPVIQWFWQCVENMSNEDRARLLQFVTGSSQVPSGGFQTLEPKFNVQLNFAPPSHLPVSHTCFNTIELPDYRSFEQLQDRLALALKEGAEGFGEA